MKAGPSWLERYRRGLPLGAERAGAEPPIPRPIPDELGADIVRDEGEDMVLDDDVGLP